MFLVLGNVTIDEAMRADAWPAPGQTVVVGAARRDLGGKGVNQALILKRAGAPVRFVAAIGRDRDGDWAASTLRGEGLDDTDLLRVEPPTDRSLIFVGRDGENAIASTTEAARSIGAAAAAAIGGSLGTGDTLVMQGNLTLDATRAALAAARRGGARTIFNPSPLQQGFASLLGLVDLLVLNQGEAEALAGEGAPEAALDVLRAAGAGRVVLTLGGQGAVATADHAALRVPARRVPVLDTTGAGDTFTGILAAGLFERGLPLRAAIDAASAAAAITVGRRGTLSAFPGAGEIAGIFAGLGA